MCLFPKKNKKYDLLVDLLLRGENGRQIIKSANLRQKLKNQPPFYNCGYCPECLGKRASHWALRAVYQAKESKDCCMITLTYDTFKYDKNGNIIGENLNLRNVDKRDCQLFMKRLREYFKRKKNVDNIKYLLSAEYGKRTGRPHYHALLFGVKFDDLIFHKKSKRGNKIYRSPTLEKLWKNGICTVDSCNMSAAIAKYCTKYTMKDFGVDDTFMLVSQGLGVEKLLEDFNGKSYWIDGQEYPIPRIIWQKYITEKYKTESFGVTYKYVNLPKQETEYKFSLRPFFAAASFPIVSRGIPAIKKNYKQATIDYNDKMFAYKVNRIAREKFRFIRDNDLEYKAYLEYWQGKAEQKNELPILTRINMLDDKKYRTYKIAARRALTYNQNGENYVVPRKTRKNVPACASPIELYQTHKYEENERKNNVILKNTLKIREELGMTNDVPVYYRCVNGMVRRHLPAYSRHIRANDRKKRKGKWIIFGNGDICDNSVENLPIYSPVSVQLLLF